MFRVMEQAMKKSGATPRSASIDHDLNITGGVRSTSQFYTFNNNDLSEPTSNNATPTPTNVTNTRMLSLITNQESTEEVNKKLTDMLGELRTELSQQRKFADMLNKTHQELQLQYSKDTQQWMSQINSLSNEKQELMKDLDLALEREAMASNKLQHESKKYNDKMDKIPNLKTQINKLENENKDLISNNQILTNLASKIDHLSNLYTVQSNKSAENYEKIKLVFEDTAMQLDKYHENQQLVDSLRRQLQVIRNEKQLNMI